MNRFFDVNDIADAGKKRAGLLLVIGTSTYALLRNLVSPAKPGEKLYNELVSVLKDPTPSETVQCSQFNSLYWKPGESVAKFVADLHALAEFCIYGESLDKIRDRVVCGIVRYRQNCWQRSQRHCR